MEWLGTGSSLPEAVARELPPLMATAPPRPKRWHTGADVLAPLLESKDVAEMCARLGYDDSATWI